MRKERGRRNKKKTPVRKRRWYEGFVGKDHQRKETRGKEIELVTSYHVAMGYLAICLPDTAIRRHDSPIFLEDEKSPTLILCCEASSSATREEVSLSLLRSHQVSSSTLVRSVPLFLLSPFPLRPFRPCPSFRPFFFFTMQVFSFLASLFALQAYDCR